MNWPRLIFLFLEWLWMLLGLGCLAGAAILALSNRRWQTLERWLDDTAGRGHRIARVVFGVCLPCFFALFKVGQLYSQELMADSSRFANMAWNMAHGYGPLAHMVPVLAGHFSFTVALLGPLLWIWENTAV